MLDRLDSRSANSSLGEGFAGQGRELAAEQESTLRRGLGEMGSGRRPKRSSRLGHRLMGGNLLVDEEAFNTCCSISIPLRSQSLMNLADTHSDKKERNQRSA